MHRVCFAPDVMCSVLGKFPHALMGFSPDQAGSGVHIVGLDGFFGAVRPDSMHVVVAQADHWSGFGADRASSWLRRTGCLD